MKRYNPWLCHPDDPACPYDEDYTEEDEEAQYEEYVDAWIDARLEREG